VRILLLALLLSGLAASAQAADCPYNANAAGLAQGQSLIPITPTVETYPLEDANRALLELKHGRIRGAKVLRVGP
jgi:hypothetical protein